VVCPITQGDHNKWMWIVAAYQQTHRASQLAWFEGWQPSGAQSAFIK